MKHYKRQTCSLVFVILAFVCAMTISSTAQDVTTLPTTETVASPTHGAQPTHIQNAEVIHVSGHHLVVELANGGFELLNLPEDFKFQIDGKDLTVHELTPGTKLSQEIHTVTTPQEVTTLRTLNGRVFHVNPPRVIVSLPEGGNREFRVPDDAVFQIDGRDKTVFDLREGMTFSATVLTVTPVTAVSHHTVISGQAPPRPNVAFDGPMLIEETKELSMTAAVEEPPAQKLPETASLVPSIGILGLLSLGLYLGMRVIRRRTA